eukprot:m.1617180 g.1617180  ORF g.1617180 m.1617180 type:complete len:1743 (+) comp25372_c0_seq76:15-5243(+)
MCARDGLSSLHGSGILQRSLYLTFVSLGRTNAVSPATDCVFYLRFSTRLFVAHIHHSLFSHCEDCMSMANMARVLQLVGHIVLLLQGFDRVFSQLTPAPPTCPAPPPTQAPTVICELLDLGSVNARVLSCSGTSCNVGCLTGYFRTASSISISCDTAAGRWSRNLQALRCDPQTCAVPAIPNASFPGCTNPVTGTACIAICNSGYAGMATAYTCNGPGPLSPVGSAISCAPVTCSLPTLINAAFAASCANPRHLGAPCTATCSAGFVGSSATYTCPAAGGVLVPTTDAISCVRRVCAPPVLVNARFTATCDQQFESTCVATCDPGFDGSDVEYTCRDTGATMTPVDRGAPITCSRSVATTAVTAPLCDPVWAPGFCTVGFFRQELISPPGGGGPALTITSPQVALGLTDNTLLFQDSLCSDGTCAEFFLEAQGGSGIYSWLAEPDLNDVATMSLYWGLQWTPLGDRIYLTGQNLMDPLNADGTLNPNARQLLAITVVDAVSGQSTSATVVIVSTESLLPEVTDFEGRTPNPTAAGYFQFNATEEGPAAFVFDARGAPADYDTTCTLLTVEERMEFQTQTSRAVIVNASSLLPSACFDQTWFQAVADACPENFWKLPYAVCNADCINVLRKTHPEYTNTTSQCLEYIASNTAETYGVGVSRLRLDSINGTTMENLTIPEGGARFLDYGGNVLANVFNYPRTCIDPGTIVKMPGGLNASGGCDLSGTLQSNGPFASGASPFNTVVFSVLINKTDGDIVSGTVLTTIADVVVNIFSPVRITYQNLNGTITADLPDTDDDVAVAVEIDRGQVFEAFMVISGGQQPYRISAGDLPCDLAFATTYRVQGDLDCPLFAQAATSTFETIDMGAITVTDDNAAIKAAPNIDVRTGANDCGDPTNGPNGAGCRQGAACIDTFRFDNVFTCDCTGVTGETTGDNCAEPVASSSDNSAVITISLLAVVGVLVVYAAYVTRKRKLKMAPHDFEQQLQDMINQGIIKEVHPGEQRRIPEELPRSSVILIDVLGAGEFGEVMKGVRLGGSDGTVYEESTVVAVKTLKGVKGDVDRKEKETLMAEATVTAQFRHPNIVSLIGVVTTGTPLMIVLELCEGGELKKLVSKYVVEPEGKIRFCYGIAKGMEYLAGLGFIHRDLAARNVLVDRYDTPKIADFGLTKDTEQADYYVASGGKVPIRWTAVEALNKRKFSEFSDVWAYGVTCYEVWTNGMKPYKKWPNSVVIERVLAGYTLPWPKKSGCPEDLYEECIAPCFTFEYRKRPTFKVIVNRLAKYADDAERAKLASEAPEEVVDDVEVRGTGLDPKFFNPKLLQRNQEERKVLSCFYGCISETEAEDILRTQEGTTRYATDDLSTRKVYLMREVDEFTVILSVYVGLTSMFGHHVVDFSLDLVWAERDPVTGKSKPPLGKHLSEVIYNILKEFDLLDAEALVNPDRASEEHKQALMSSAKEQPRKVRKLAGPATAAKPKLPLAQRQQLGFSASKAPSVMNEAFDISDTAQDVETEGLRVDNGYEDTAVSTSATTNDSQYDDATDVVALLSGDTNVTAPAKLHDESAVPYTVVEVDRETAARPPPPPQGRVAYSTMAFSKNGVVVISAENDNGYDEDSATANTGTDAVDTDGTGDDNNVLPTPFDGDSEEENKMKPTEGNARADGKMHLDALGWPTPEKQDAGSSGAAQAAMDDETFGRNIEAPPTKKKKSRKTSSSSGNSKIGKAFKPSSKYSKVLDGAGILDEEEEL